MIMKLDKTVVSPSHLEIYKQYTATYHMLSPCQAGEVAKRLKPRLPAPPVAGSLVKLMKLTKVTSKTVSADSRHPF